MMMKDWLANQAAITPDQLALKFQDQTWNYRQLDDWAAQTAARLSALGVRPGAHVGLLLTNQPAYIALIHALAKVGAVLVPLNTRLTGREICWQVENGGCRFLIHDQDERQPEFDLPEQVSQIAVGALAPDPADQPIESREIRADDLQGIYFTSGTTGFPKGAQISYGNLAWSAAASAYRLGLHAHDRWLLAMPLYHIGGQAIVFRACQYGIPIILHEKFEPAAVYASLASDRVTLVSLVPTMLARMLDIFAGQGIPGSLRVVLLGGAGAPKSLLDQALQLGLPLSLTYGLTEAASQVATTTPEETRNKPGCAGKPLMFTQVEIRGESGARLPAMQTGEIVIGGPSLFHGYYRHGERGARPQDYATGDLGYLDDDGDLWVVGRHADLIVCGGENIYPLEIENILKQYPGAGQVCVVGLPDEEWGQRVAALIVPDGERFSLDDLLEFARPMLAAYKLPRELIFVPELPYTASGKLKRLEALEQLTTARQPLMENGSK